MTFYKHTMTVNCCNTVAMNTVMRKVHHNFI